MNDILLGKFGLFLRILFRCHGEKERSFQYKNKQFPLCARCTGIFLGLFVSLLFYLFGWYHYILFLILLIPMLIDGVCQYVFYIMSNNKRRFITGILFGTGYLALCIDLIFGLFL